LEEVSDRARQCLWLVPRDKSGAIRDLDGDDRETAAYVHWCNEQRLHSACGDIPPAEFETAYTDRLDEPTDAMETQ
jgi:putative transposase